jgi:hypothetical protein
LPCAVRASATAGQPTRLVPTATVCAAAPGRCAVACVSGGRTAPRKTGVYENSWHWVRDKRLGEDDPRYREANGVQILTTLRSLAINALRLSGFWSLTEGIAALAHDIKGLLMLLGWQEPAPETTTG